MSRHTKGIPLNTMILKTDAGRRVRIVSINRQTGMVNCIDLATGMPIRMGRANIPNLPTA